jgi:Right handed beta helix region
MCRLPTRPVFALFLGLLQTMGCGVASNPCNLPPSITGQPTNQTLTAGQFAIFTVASAGTAPLSYQWLKNGVPILGATNSSYSIPSISSNDSGSSFSVNITNTFGTLTSNSASLTVSPAPPSNIRFVAPNGSDSNVGSVDQPYLSIQHCATTVAPGWICAVRAGTYRETVTPNSGVTIASYNGESVVVDGSDPVSGWTLYQGSIYKANVNLATDDTNQIFVGNEMMTEARWPNSNDLFNANWAVEQKGTDLNHISDSNLPSINWTGAKIHLWSGTDPFGHQTGNVTASSLGRITIDVGQAGTCPSICPTAGGFYYLFGTLGALDVPHEWFYDATERVLYFMAPGGVDPRTLAVRAKRRQYAFDLRGKSGVTIQNIAIFASTIVTDASSSNNTLDRINAQYVSHFTDLTKASDDSTGTAFSILRVHNSDSGIIIGGSGNILQNSTIAYSAGAGIALEGHNNTLRNNLIHDIDYIGDYDSGIDLDGDGNTIQYNTINTIGRQAILLTDATNQDISYNNLFNSMIYSRDGAEIYACCWQVSSGTEIHHNWIHDTQALIHGAGDDNPTSGIYIDIGGSGFNVDQNVLWNNQRNHIVLNGVSNAPNDNFIHNNTIPDASDEAHIVISYIPNCGSSRVVDNKMIRSVRQIHAECITSNNSPSAPGATEMPISSAVGCNFAGCSSNGPPVILDNGSISPCSVTHP